MSDPKPPAHGVDFDALPPVSQGNTLGAEWWIAVKHLSSRQQETFLSLVAVLSVVGVVVGVATVNIVLSVMTGFEVDLRDKILGANAHILVVGTAGLINDPERVVQETMAVPGVLAAAPMVYTEAMIRAPAGGVGGIIIKGADPERTGDVTDVRDDLILGPDGPLTTPEARTQLFRKLAEPCLSRRAARVAPLLEGLVDDEPGPLPCILVGGDLAEQMAIGPGSVVQLIDPLGGGSGPMGVPMPRVRQFRVLGVYDSGMFEYDTKWTYVGNADAEAFLNIAPAVTGVELKVDDIDNVEAISAAIEARLGPTYDCRHWKELNQPLFEALALEKYVMGLILFLIVGVAALLIVTTLIMVVMTKTREISILKAMGASESSILRIFIIEGSVIGFLGTTIGTTLGLAGCKFLDWYGYELKTDVYFVNRLPVVIEWQNVVFIAISAFVVCFVATWYPAWRAASLDPIEGLRYE